MTHNSARMGFGLGLSVLMTLLSACSSMHVRQYPEAVPIALSGKSHPIIVKQIMGGIHLGQEIGTVQIGAFCIPRENSRWKRSEPVRLISKELGEQFRRELTESGYEVVEASDSLFEDPQEGKAKFLLGGILTHLVHNRCFAYPGINYSLSTSGEASVEVEWQLYERRTHSVVYKTVTGGTAKTTPGLTGGKDAYNRALGLRCVTCLAILNLQRLCPPRRSLPPILGQQMSLPPETDSCRYAWTEKVMCMGISGI